MLNFVVFIIIVSAIAFWSIILESLIARIFMKTKRLRFFGRVLFYDTGLDRNKMHKVCKYKDCESCRYFEKNCKGFIND